jgi:hypothetical protein
MRRQARPPPAGRVLAGVRRPEAVGEPRKGLRQPQLLLPHPPRQLAEGRAPSPARAQQRRQRPGSRPAQQAVVARLDLLGQPQPKPPLPWHRRQPFGHRASLPSLLLVPRRPSTSTRASLCHRSGRASTHPPHLTLSLLSSRRRLLWVSNQCCTAQASSAASSQEASARSGGRSSQLATVSAFDRSLDGNGDRLARRVAGPAATVRQERRRSCHQLSSPTCPRLRTAQRDPPRKQLPLTHCRRGSSRKRRASRPELCSATQRPTGRAEGSVSMQKAAMCWPRLAARRVPGGRAIRGPRASATSGRF